jgi:hypothetical protein
LFLSITHGICVKCVFSFSSYCRASDNGNNRPSEYLCQGSQNKVELWSHWPVKSLNDEIIASTLLKGGGVEVPGFTRLTLMIPLGKRTLDSFGKLFCSAYVI